MPLGRIVIYAKDIEATRAFYVTHFPFEASVESGDRIVELVATDGGANIMLHPAAKGQNSNQSIVKLVFDVADVASFCQRAAEGGLRFGPIHRASGYAFANARDPCGNSISVSSRAFRKAGHG